MSYSGFRRALAGLKKSRDTLNRDTFDQCERCARCVTARFGCSESAPNTGKTWRRRRIRLSGAVPRAYETFTSVGRTRISIHVSVAAVAPALVLAMGVGTALQITLALTTNYVDGGAAGGACVGSLIGTTVTNQWYLARAGGKSVRWRFPSSRWILSATGLGATIAALVAGAVIGLLALAHGYLQGPLAIATLVVTALLPFTAFGVEVARGGRFREFIQSGWRSALLVALGFLALGVFIYLCNPSVDHREVYSGFVAGGFTGLAIGGMYFAPSMLLGAQAPIEVRAVASAFGLTVTLAVLAFAIPKLDAATGIAHEVGTILVYYLVTSLGTALVTAVLSSQALRDTRSTHLGESLP